MSNQVAQPPTTDRTTDRTTVHRCLIVEDELDHCEMIAECLASDGGQMELVFAHTVDEACEYLGAFQPRAARP